MAIGVDSYGVHVSHCCKQHGCAYGKVDCPVYQGEAVQEFPCCDCPSKIGYLKLKEQLAEMEADMFYLESIGLEVPISGDTDSWHDVEHYSATAEAEWEKRKAN